MLLAGKLLLIVPADDVPMTAFGLLKLVWLRALKSSHLACSLKRSLIAKSRRIPASRLKYPGPRIIPVPALPKVNCAGIANAATLNQCEISCCTPLGMTLGLLTQFGRSAVVVRTAAPVLCVFETGVPILGANH